MQMTTVGIDGAKQLLQRHSMDKRRHVVLTKRLARATVRP
jgi:hypothetical protein